MYKISIVIPMHNVEQYLNETIESIIKQTIEFENIELILVDDASTDSTSKIALNYKEKYSNIRYLRLKNKSGSAGKPRNEGTRIATGKYIMYVDADDLLDENACLLLYNQAVSLNAQCIIANYKNMDEDGEIWNEPQFDCNKYSDFRINIEDYHKSLFVLESAVWNKIYQLDFIKENNLKFLEGVPAEDAYFCINSFLEAKKIYYTNEVIYYYRLRNKKDLSVSNQCNKKYFMNYNEGYKLIYKLIDEYQNEIFGSFFFSKAILFMIYKFIDSEMLTHKEKVEILETMHWFYSLTKTFGVIITEKYIEMIIEKIIEKQYNEAIEYCTIIANIRKDLPKEINAKMSEQNDSKYVQAMELRRINNE